MEMFRCVQVEHLEVRIYENRAAMGAAAAVQAAGWIREVADKKDEINIIFASAPSQNEFLDALGAMQLPWQRVNAFHMDEYIGIPADAPQGFANFLRRSIFNKLTLKGEYYMDSEAEPAAECKRYSDLLLRYPADIIFMGIGENAHIAFCEPSSAFLNDPETVKIVALDEASRKQQVNDKCFPAIDDVPKHALTITVPVMLRVPHMMLVVPSKLKANAIKNAVRGQIDEKIPASLIRTRENQAPAILFTDEDGAVFL